MPSTDIYDVLLTRSDRAQVLLLHGCAGWRLPNIAITAPPGDHRWRNTAPFNAALSEKYSLPAKTLRLLALEEQASENRLQGVLAMEAQAAFPLADGQHWYTAQEVQTLPLAIETQRDIIAQWFRQQSDVTFLAGSMPWMQPGWFVEATRWMEDTLHAAGRTITGPIEQMRSWFISCVLRAPTTGGDVWFKACPPYNRYEPPLTEALAHAYPEMLPRVLGVDNERRWLLTQGIDGVRLNQHPDTAHYLPRWEALLLQMARIQRDWERQTDTLLAWGCPDWRPATLAKEVAEQFDSIGQWFAAQGEEDSVADLSGLAAQIARLASEMDRSGLPPTFSHWDFHSGNLLANDLVCKTIDWTGGLAHPFTLLSVVYEEHHDEAVRARLRDIYLEAWRDVASLETLHAMVNKALILAAVQNALGHFTSLQYARTPWERKADEGNLRWYLLHYLPQLLSAH